MQWLYRVIGQAGIFLICAQIVVHFRPKESYDNYLKLLLSVMLLLQLLQPVLTALGSAEGWNVEEQVAGFTEELQTVLTRASEQAEQSQGEIGNTARAVAEEAEHGYGQGNTEETASAQGDIIIIEENGGDAPKEGSTEQKKTDRESTEAGGIRVEVAPIRLE